MGEKDVTDGPEIGINVPYIKIMLGGGGMNHY